jgi:hypothetical protein
MADGAVGSAQTPAHLPDPEPGVRCQSSSKVGDLELGFGVQGIGFRVQGLQFRVQGLGFRVQGSGFRV